MPQSVNIEGEMIGQLAVGNQIIKIGSIHGARANIATQPPTVRSRSISVPKQLPFYLRLDEPELIINAIASLQSGQSVELYSPAGFVNNTLLLAIAYNHQVTSSFPDGVISLSPLHPYVGDLLQSIWCAFYETDIPYKPTDHQIRQQIQDKQALIVMDDGNKLTQYELQELMNAAPKCSFLIASSVSRIHLNSVLLPQISLNNAIALVEQELQHSLLEEEIPVAKSLYTILNGQPMHLQLAAASLSADGLSLAQFVSQLPKSAPSEYIIQQILASLSESQRSVLDLLAVMGDVGLEREQIVAIAKVPDTVDTLLRLCRRHLVKYSHRYRINKTIVAVLPPEWKLTIPLSQAIAYFINWTQQQPKTLGLEIDAIAQIIEVAVKASRWSDVLRLVKAVEGSIALSQRWGLWEQVLQRGLQASQAQQDQAAVAWVLHQLGTYALCQQDQAIAISYLQRAIKLRESLGDEIGVSASRHNLNLLNTEEVSQISFLQNQLARMTVVVNPSPSRQSLLKNISFSPTKVITTVILTSSGLLAWFNWHRLIPILLPKPHQTVSTPNPSIKHKSKVTPSASPIPKRKSKATSSPPPIPKPTVKVDPPLTPKIEFQTPAASKRQKSNAPIPTPTRTTPKQATPTRIPQQPSLEITPTPTRIPQQPSLEITPTPTRIPQQPSLEFTPTPQQPTFTPTPVSTPTTDATTVPSVIITPLLEPKNY